MHGEARVVMVTVEKIDYYKAGGVRQEVYSSNEVTHIGMRDL